jgi:hypothetical protein
MTDDDLPIRQASVPSSDPPVAASVTGKVAKAINLMVWHGIPRNEAAHRAGLKPHSLYKAMRKPPVKQAYLQECEVLRVSGRARRLHRLEELALQDDNRNAAVAAIKAAEMIPDEATARGGQTLPGLQIVIVQGAPTAGPGPTINVTPYPPQIEQDDDDPTIFRPKR